MPSLSLILLTVGTGLSLAFSWGYSEGRRSAILQFPPPPVFQPLQAPGELPPPPVFRPMTLMVRDAHGSPHGFEREKLPSQAIRETTRKPGETRTRIIFH